MANRFDWLISIVSLNNQIIVSNSLDLSKLAADFCFVISTWKMHILVRISWSWLWRMGNRNALKHSLTRRRWKKPWGCLGTCLDPIYPMPLIYLCPAGGTTDSSVAATATTPSFQTIKMFMTLRYFHLISVACVCLFSLWLYMAIRSYSSFIEREGKK